MQSTEKPETQIKLFWEFNDASLSVFFSNFWWHLTIYDNKFQFIYKLSSIHIN